MPLYLTTWVWLSFMTSFLALHNSPSSSVACQGSNQMMQHIYSFPIRAFVSRFHGLLTKGLKLQIMWGGLRFQIISLARVCVKSISQALSPVVNTPLHLRPRMLVWKCPQYAKWQSLLHPFSTCEGSLPCLRGTSYCMSFTMPVGESVREVLPGLQSIFFGEPPPNTTFPESHLAGQ